MFPVRERVVLVQHAAVARGEDDFDRDPREIAGGFAAGGVVGKRIGRLGEDGAAEDRIGIPLRRGAGDDAIAGARVQFADDRLGHRHLGVIRLRAAKTAPRWCERWRECASRASTV